MLCHRPALPLCLQIAALITLCAGCTTTKQSNTARTATEQLLISNAVDQSLNKIDFVPLAGSCVFVEEKYIDCVDKGYIVASVRHKLLQANATLASKIEEADTVMEIRSGGVGTDVTSSYLGVPGFTMPGMIGIPDIKVINRDSQRAIAKLGIVVYDLKTKRERGDGGMSMAKADENNTYFMGFGPHQSGTLRYEVDHGVGLHPGERVREIPHSVAFSERPADDEKTSGGNVKLSGGEAPEK